MLAKVNRKYVVDGDAAPTDGGVGITVGFMHDFEFSESDAEGNDIPVAAIGFSAEPGSVMDVGFRRKSFDTRESLVAELAQYEIDPETQTFMSAEGLEARQVAREVERAETEKRQDEVLRSSLKDKILMKVVEDSFEDKEELSRMVEEEFVKIKAIIPKRPIRSIGVVRENGAKQATRTPTKQEFRQGHTFYEHEE